MPCPGQVRVALADGLQRLTQRAPPEGTLPAGQRHQRAPYLPDDVFRAAGPAAQSVFGEEGHRLATIAVTQLWQTLRLLLHQHELAGAPVAEYRLRPDVSEARL